MTTSLKVAEYFEKRHDIVLRAIENAKSNLRKIVDVEKAIIATTYVDVKGECTVCYFLFNSLSSLSTLCLTNARSTLVSLLYCAGNKFLFA